MFKSGSLFLRTALAVVIGAFAPAVLAAQGVISGTVVDQSAGLTITGASVRIVALEREVITDRAGRFVFIGIPAGSHELSVRYMGFVAESRTVSVIAGGMQSLVIELAPVRTDLGAVVVTAARSGQAAALNQQLNAANVTNVVAADQIGRFPDANIGDAMKRIPGITIELDQGEARFGGVRGTEPRFNSVTVNGERVPSAEATVREVQLDLIPADMVQAIEVNKTLTPEMDADAIGGSINVVTRAAPVGLRISATAGSGYNFIREKPVALGSLVMGNRFFDNRFGAILSGSYYDQRFGSDNKEGVWDRTGAGVPYIHEFDVRRYDVQRVRRSISGSFDYRLGDNSSIMYRGIYNHRDDFENRFRNRFVLDEPTAAGSQVASEIRRQTKGGGPGRPKFTRLEEQKTQSHQLSGEHLLAGRATFSWSASAAKASEYRPDERYIEWRAQNIQLATNYSDEQNPTFTPTNPATVTPSAFTFRRIEALESLTEDEDRNGRIDLMLPLVEGINETRIKFGARVRMKDKFRNNSFSRAVPLVGSEFGNMTTNPFQDYTVGKNMTGPYDYGNFTTPGFLGSLDFRNTSRFTLQDRPDEYAAGNFDAQERITAGYGQLERNFGPAVSVIAGARVENTNIDYNGVSYVEDDDSITPTSGSDSYTDILPSINLRWEAAPGTVIRGAWSQSLARPNYFQLVPYRIVNEGDSEVSVGNPDLEPTRSNNFDLMAERYFTSVGMISVGVFHKQITDFIFDFSSFNATDPISGNVYSVVTQPRNGANARITGAEFAIQRQLDFLPGLMRNVGVYANYTLNNSRATGIDVPGRENEDLPLLGTARHVGNLSLSYDGSRFTLRSALNFQSEAIDAREGGYSDEAFFDRWADRRLDLDLNSSFAINATTRFFVEANNLTNRPLRYYQGVRGRLMQDEFYGRRVQTGFKFDF
jgi:TonB-dependent receptor